MHDYIARYVEIKDQPFRVRDVIIYQLKPTKSCQTKIYNFLKYFFEVKLKVTTYLLYKKGCLVI